MLKSKYVVSAIIPFVLGVSACSSTGSTLPKSTTTIPGTTTTTTINMLLSDTTTTTPPLTTTIDGGVATTTTAKVATTTPTTINATAKNWEVVVGIFATKPLAQAQLDKLTKAGITGFSIKALPSKFAVVKVGYTNAEATVLMKKINTAGTGTATIFHLTSSGTTATTAPSATATNFEVVEGIYTTKALAQAKLDKLTKAGVTGFSIKTLTSSFAVVKADLTNAEATALVKKVDAAGFGPSRVKQL